MTTYNHDEFFKWMDEGPEQRRHAFSSIFDAMKHPDREELSEIKADGILRSHFVILKRLSGAPDEHLRIEMLYRLEKAVDVKMSIITVTVYDDFNQHELYRSMEQTQSTDAKTGNKPQMN
jgi:hypothetical protein